PRRLRVVGPPLLLVGLLLIALQLMVLRPQPMIARRWLVQGGGLVEKDEHVLGGGRVGRRSPPHLRQQQQQVVQLSLEGRPVLDQRQLTQGRPPGSGHRQRCPPFSFRAVLVVKRRRPIARRFRNGGIETHLVGQTAELLDLLPGFVLLLDS